MKHPPSFWAVRAAATTGLAVIIITGLFLGSRLNQAAPTTTNAADMCSNTNVTLNNASTYKTGNTPYSTALYQRSPTSTEQTYVSVYALGVPVDSSSAHDAAVAVNSDLSKTYGTGIMPQLIGCIYRSNETATTQTCTYNDNIVVPVYNASYTLTVYEAKTHKKVLTTTVASTPTYTCQSYTTYNGKRFYRPWDQTAIALALQPLLQ